LQEAWFCGMKFYVDEAVLIPRPETEELVEWVAEEAARYLEKSVPEAGVTAAGGPPLPFSLLDVGTGSGCIAIALHKKLSHISVHACDISEEALAIARLNAARLEAGIQFHQLDFLDRLQRETLPGVHFLVSNPPYIPLWDKKTMGPHVVDFEPHLALFVSSGDPLIFYRALAEWAKDHLKPGGALFAEIHEEFAGPILQLFQEVDFQAVVLKQDLQGKDRMIKATR
jgi:release factor glutamine methyltransferase